MAILIEKQVPKMLAFGANSVTANYWKITEIFGQVIEKLAVVKLSGYVSAEARQAGLEPIDFKQISFNSADYLFDTQVLNASGVNPIALAYTKIKTLPEFQGALDV